MSANRFQTIQSQLFSRRHTPFLTGLGCAVLVTAAMAALAPRLALEVGAVSFFSVYLLLMARRMPTLSATYLKKHAAASDEPEPVILAVTALTVAVAIGSLFIVLNSPKENSIIELTLAFASVLLGWLTIHTMTAMHYAHRYWQPGLADESGKVEHRAGLDFPGDDEPGGYDFLYFSFVIGMTAQTSDVAINTTTMRRLNLVHAITSFFFNTVLVAAAVNAAVALAG
ncbi:MAG: DUF1345 domain-containing protein [Allorhizobium sp.]